jgi:hypothetical protein
MTTYRTSRRAQRNYREATLEEDLRARDLQMREWDALLTGRPGAALEFAEWARLRRERRDAEEGVTW